MNKNIWTIILLANGSLFAMEENVARSVTVPPEHERVDSAREVLGHAGYGVDSTAHLQALLHAFEQMAQDPALVHTRVTEEHDALLCERGEAEKSPRLFLGRIKHLWNCYYSSNHLLKNKDINCELHIAQGDLAEKAKELSKGAFEYFIAYKEAEAVRQRKQKFIVAAIGGGATLIAGIVGSIVSAHFECQ